VELLEDNPIAMCLIIRSLYGESPNAYIGRLPVMNLHFLHTLATLTDKCQRHSLIATVAKYWASAVFNLMEEFPDALEPDLFSWLWIAWTFGLKDYFQQLTVIIQQNVHGSIALGDKQFGQVPE
jgi:hypothetical protein